MKWNVKKRISCIVANLGYIDGAKYVFALATKKGGIPILKSKIWKFSIKSRGFDFYCRPNHADIFLVRAMILGSNLDGVGEYDISALFERFNKDDELVMLDLGANIGIFSLLMSSAFPKAKIYAVEPDEENFRILLKNVGEKKNITCVNVGVWNRDCMLKLVNPGCESMSFRFEESTDNKGTEAISIPSILCKYGLSHVDILKMDIEGGEKSVFESNVEWCNDVDFFIIEMHDRYAKGASDTVDRQLVELRGYNKTSHEENDIYYKL